MKHCPYCNQEIKPGMHIYNCAKKHKIDKDKKEIKYDFIIYNFPILTKEFIIQKYEKELWSLPDFNKEIGTDNKTVHFLVDYYEIHKRGLSESSELISQEKYKKTCMEKYGVDNCSKLESIQKKKEETFIKNYGVDNIFKHNEFKQYIAENNFAWMYESSRKQRSVSQSKSIRHFWENVSDERKSEIHAYNKKQYQNWWFGLTDEERIIEIQKRTCYASRIETRVMKVLTDNNISFQSQVWIDRKSYDIKLSKTKIVIEVQGDFWHANPYRYNAEDILCHPGGHITANELWQKDEAKRKLAEKYGYKVFYLWESFINKSTDEEIFNDIIKNINLLSSDK